MLGSGEKASLVEKAGIFLLKAEQLN